MCRLAGLYPAAALMEIMNDDGTNELDAENGQQDKNRNDDKVHCDLGCAYIGNADEVCENFACACDCGCHGRKNDDYVENLKEDFHPGLGIKCGECILVVVEAAELSKLHHYVHYDCQKSHCEDVAREI